MEQYNEAVQWLHDNPLKHKKVKLRNGTTATAFHCGLDTSFPIILQITGSKKAFFRLPGGGLSCRKDEYPKDIVGFADPEPVFDDDDSSEREYDAFNKDAN